MALENASGRIHSRGLMMLTAAAKRFRGSLILRFRLFCALGLAASVLISSMALAQIAPGAFSFRKEVTPQFLNGQFVLPLHARPLPPGKGDAVAGAKILAKKCAICHGITGLQAIAADGCWRHPKLLFNFIRRRMPVTKPGSLKNDEAYAVVAYLLSVAKVIEPGDVMNAKTLGLVVTPNRDGFVPNSCSDLSLHR